MCSVGKGREEVIKCPYAMSCSSFLLSSPLPEIAGMLRYNSVVWTQTLSSALQC